MCLGRAMLSQHTHTIVDTLTHSCRVKLAFRKEKKKSEFGLIGIGY